MGFSATSALVPSFQAQLLITTVIIIIMTKRLLRSKRQRRMHTTTPPPPPPTFARKLSSLPVSVISDSVFPHIQDVRDLLRFLVATGSSSTDDGRAWRCAVERAVETVAALYGLKRRGGGEGKEEEEETVSSLAYAVVIHQRKRGLADPYKAEGYEAYTWGVGCYGQLGHGTVTPYEYLSQPTLVKSLLSKPLTSVQCGGQHTLFSTSEGEVYACGNHGSGQLGIGEVLKRANVAGRDDDDEDDHEEEEEEEYPYTFPDALSTRKKQSVPIPS